jgi:putative ATPase
MEDIENERTGEVPIHLRDASYKGAARLGHGAGYKYPHDFSGHFVPQQYLPDTLTGKVYYEPTSNGYEKQIAERLAGWRKKRGQSQHER